MRMVRQIITDGEPKLVVLSAMSGTTNSLVEISSHLYQQHPHKASEVMARLEEKYARVVEALYATPEYREKGQVVTEGIFRMMRLFLHKSFTLKEEKILVAQGSFFQRSFSRCSCRRVATVLFCFRRWISCGWMRSVRPTFRRSVPCCLS